MIKIQRVGYTSDEGSDPRMRPFLREQEHYCYGGYRSRYPIGEWSGTFGVRLRTFSSVECSVKCEVAGILFAINE
jgi:hypothetical protein